MKIFKIIALVLGIVGLGFFFVTLGADITKDKNGGIVSGFIAVSYIALFLAIALVLYFVVKGIMQDKAGFKKTMISLGLFLGVFVLSFIFAKSDAVTLKDGSILSSGYSKLVSTFLNMFYILAFVSIATLVWTNLKLKK